MGGRLYNEHKLKRVAHFWSIAVEQLSNDTISHPAGD